VIHDRQRPIDRVGLLVYTHEEIRETRLDLALAVATAVVFDEQRIRERSELSRFARCRARGFDARDRRRRLIAPETAQEPTLLLFGGRIRGGRLWRRRPFVRARRHRLRRRLFLLRRGGTPGIGVRRLLLRLGARGPGVRWFLGRRWWRRRPGFGRPASAGRAPPILWLLRGRSRRRGAARPIRGRSRSLLVRIGRRPRFGRGRRRQRLRRRSGLRSRVRRRSLGGAILGRGQALDDPVLNEAGQKSQRLHL